MTSTGTNASVLETVTLVERPDLVGVCAAWSFGQWGLQTDKGTLEETVTRFEEAADPENTHRHTFVVLSDGIPAGMASLMPTDLDTRPDLGPWMTSVYVHEDFRGSGIASDVCERVAELARELDHSPIYLFTPSAERLYAQLGWKTMETVDSPHGESTLMELELSPS